MPRTYATTHTIYQFDELTLEAQDRAIEKLYDLNVDHEWWDWIYEDAEQIGMKITAFDFNRGGYIKAEFTEYPLEICKLIMTEHGQDTATYQAAIAYLKEHKKLSVTEVTRLCQVEADQLCECFSYKEGVFDIEQDYFDGDVFEDIDEDFHNDLKNEYLSMLRKEYEYQTSREVIIETIEANKYEFTEEGEII